jgi:hypothetical protein
MGSAVSTAPAPKVDRRSAVRRQPTYGTVCHLQLTSGQPSAIALVWNLSNTGVSLLSHQAVEPGRTILAKLQNGTGSFSVRRELRIVHSQELQTGDYMLGAQFDEPLQFEETRYFVL